MLGNPFRIVVVALTLAFFVSSATAVDRVTADAPAVPAGDASLTDKVGPTIDRSLSVSWLLETSQPGAKPFIVIGYYNLTQGLLAGYQASNGKRILFNAVWVPGGRVAASATHVGPQTGRIKTFYGPRTLNGQKPHVQFAGVDVMAYLQDAKAQGFARRSDAVNDFIDSASGEAFYEAVPALYATLEQLETDPSFGALQAPFGVLLTALQIATTKYGGFTQADAILGNAHANQLRNNCQAAKWCAFSGKRFKVQTNGLFDTLSKSTPATKGAKESSGAPGPFSRSFLKNGNGDCTDPGLCFGRCGRGCDGQPWMGMGCKTSSIGSWARAARTISSISRETRSCTPVLGATLGPRRTRGAHGLWRRHRGGRLRDRGTGRDPRRSRSPAGYGHCREMVRSWLTVSSHALSQQRLRLGVWNGHFGHGRVAHESSLERDLLPIR